MAIIGQVLSYWATLIFLLNKIKYTTINGKPCSQDTSWQARLVLVHTNLNIHAKENVISNLKKEMDTSAQTSEWDNTINT